MKKIAYILLLVLCGCLGNAGDGVARTAAARTGAECLVVPFSQEQWRCEQAYNSDLVLPRAVAELEPVCIRTVLRISRPERLGVRCGVACGRMGAKVDCFPEFILDLRVGASPADYYIRRRHRLII